jgi:hypothetical protein
MNNLRSLIERAYEYCAGREEDERTDHRAYRAEALMLWRGKMLALRAILEAMDGDTEHLLEMTSRGRKNDL